MTVDIQTQGHTVKVKRGHTVKVKRGHIVKVNVVHEFVHNTVDGWMVDDHFHCWSVYYNCIRLRGF